MAVLAFGAKLAAMYVGVAIRAFRANVCEDQLGVTQPALHLVVHASQWEAGLAVVIEFGIGADRGPTRRSVATPARGLQGRPMRVARRAALHLSLPLVGGDRATS